MQSSDTFMSVKTSMLSIAEHIKVQYTDYDEQKGMTSVTKVNLNLKRWSFRDARLSGSTMTIVIQLKATQSY